MPSVDQQKILAMSLSCATVTIGWFVLFAILLWLLRRRVRALEAAAPGTPQIDDGMGFLFYGLSSFVWAGALLCALLFLREPRTARRGFLCGLLGLLHVSALVLLVCGAMIGVAVTHPDWLPLRRWVAGLPAPEVRYRPSAEPARAPRDPQIGRAPASAARPSSRRASVPRQPGAGLDAPEHGGTIEDPERATHATQRARANTQHAHATRTPRHGRAPANAARALPPSTHDVPRVQR